MRRTRLENGGPRSRYSKTPLYKEDRLPKTIAMTAITDFLFYGFTSKSKKTRSLLTKGMETLNQSDLKNIFKDIASN